MAHQKELLANAQAFDAGEFASRLNIARVLRETSKVVTTAPHPIEKLTLEDADADPFNGNTNNRRVAARIAARREVTAGDPVKAAKDVAKSLAVNPEPIIASGDELPKIRLDMLPTPGSPAAQKVTQMPSKLQATQEAATGTEPAPPQWKPNA